jgi:hypothetical protein
MVETYSIIENIDNSIIAINNYVRDNGYEFVEVEITELESKFSNLFHLPETYDRTSEIQINDQKVSKQFYDLFSKSRLYNKDSRVTGRIVLLKRVKKFEQKISGEHVNLKTPTSILFETSEFSRVLVRKLRLFKKGDIRFYKVFHKEEFTNQIYNSLSQTNNNNSGELYSVTEEEIIELLIHLNEINFENQLCNLGLKNFELTYNIYDYSVKYISLMTVLESIFNKGRDQITHIVSRHLAILVSKNSIEFQSNYKRIKNLYNLRSKIVHGNELKPKDELVKSTKILEDYVREALKFCLKINKNKDQLFDLLNEKGF